MRTKLSHRERRTLRVIFRYYDIDKLCDMFNITKKGLEQNLADEGIPVHMVGKGAKKMFSAKKENYVGRIGRKERIIEANKEAEKEVKEHEEIRMRKALKIAYRNCIPLGDVVSIAKKHGKYKVVGRWGDREE